jgi:hypothetical protein
LPLPSNLFPARAAGTTFGFVYIIVLPNIFDLTYR